MYILPCYHLTSQLPHDSCLCRYPDFEYPDAVTFVSYVAAYLRPVSFFRVRCAAWGGIQQHFIMRLSSAGSFLFSSMLFTWSRHRLFVQYSQMAGVCQGVSDENIWGRSGRKHPGGRAACVCGGRLRRRGKSKRSKAPADGHRSDSTGIVNQFPSQRPSGSGRDALRLSHPSGLRSVKIFSRLRRCPPYTHAARPLDVFWGWLREGCMLYI